MAVKTVLEAVRDAMREEMRRDERVIVLGEDVGMNGGVFRATDGFYKEFGEERVIDTPIAESSIAGIAIGASLNGLVPVAEIQFADYIYPAMNQIMNEAARMRYRTNGDFSCPLVVRTPYGGGVHGAFYHSQSVEAFFAHVPGLKVVAPSTPYDYKGLLKAAIRDPDPVIFFEHKRSYRLVRGEVPDEDYTLPIGKAEVRRKGKTLSVFTYGLMAQYTLEVAEKLAADGIDAEVVDLRTLLPLDKETILESACKTGKVLIVHEDIRTGSVGGEIAALIAEQAFDYLDAPIQRLTGPDAPAMPFNPPQEHFFLLDPERIDRAIRTLARY